jgi:transposase IS116/IS110/IS902 family protein
LVPSERSSGPKRRTGAITKSGDIHARTLLIEAAHSYRFPARIARRKLAAIDAVPEAVRAIAWKAQTRLCQRYRHMMAKDKPTPVIVTAIARELAGFVWSIACITSDFPAKTYAIATTSDEVSPTESTGQSRAPRRQPSKTTTRRTARPEQTGAPIELRYVTVDIPCAEAKNPKASTPASRTRRSAAASAEGSAG